MEDICFQLLLIEDLGRDVVGCFWVGEWAVRDTDRITEVYVALPEEFESVHSGMVVRWWDVVGFTFTHCSDSFQWSRSRLGDFRYSNPLCGEGKRQIKIGCRNLRLICVNCDTLSLTCPLRHTHLPRHPLTVLVLRGQDHRHLFHTETAKVAKWVVCQCCFIGISTDGCSLRFFIVFYCLPFAL